jgi:4-hydroxybenzoyl-CoA reductase alpha subunit
MKEYSVIGKRLPRTDAKAKVTGEAKYTDDLRLPQMLTGKLLRSPLPHAEILHIDTSKAERLVGVKGVITGLDTPRKKYGLLMRESFMDRYPLAVDKVRFIGEEVAAVAAVDEDTALEALDLIRVEYQELPAVFHPEEAMKPGAPSVHEGKANAVMSRSFEYGDAEKGFRSSDYVREDKFTTQAVAHACMETRAALSMVDFSGKVTLWSSTQSPFILCRDLAQTLNIPKAKIRVIKPFVGGGFGGKMEMLPLEFCSALLSIRTGKPVRIVHTREEEFIGTPQRHPVIIQLKTGVKRDGTLVAKECYTIVDTGAYLTHGPMMLYGIYTFLTMLYRVPNAKFQGYCVYTNNPVRGAMRGHGNPQIRFADDSQLDLIAKDLGIDPVEIRLKNAIRTGESTPSRLRINSCGLTEAIERCAEVSNWKEVRGGLKGNNGIGIACGDHISGGKLYESYDSSSVFLKVEEDGKVVILSGASDIGQGLDSILCQIVAEEFAIPFEDVRIVAADSEVTPQDLGTYGSRGTFLAGNACLLAARDAKGQIFKTVAEKLETSVEDLELKDGRIHVKGDPQRWMSLSEAAVACNGSVLGRGTYESNTEVPDRKGQGNISPAYSFGAQVAEVKVHTDTGKVDLLRVIGAHDVGLALNPMHIEGQIEGSVVMGQGQALYEELLIRKGLTFNPSFLEYKVPTSLESPQIVPLMVETHDPEGPYGAKGLGESTMVPTIAAIANAIDHAIGVRVKELPITPIKISEMMGGDISKTVMKKIGGSSGKEG